MLPALLTCSAGLVCSHGMPSGVGIWGAATSGVREVRRGWFVGSTGHVDGGEGRLQLVFCRSAGVNPKDWVSWGNRESREGLQAGYLVFWPCGLWLNKGCLPELGAGAQWEREARRG